MLTIFLIASFSVNACLILWLSCLSKSVRQMCKCPTYQCLTRQGVDRSWKKIERRHTAKQVIFLDIDNMHRANELLGYQAVDCSIARSLKSVRSNELVGRWYSGDEIVIVTNAQESQQTAERVQAAFQENGLSATFAIVACTSPILEENTKRAAALVQAAKLIGNRGVILIDLHQ